MVTAGTCSLGPGELAAQLDRYRALGRSAADVERQRGRVVVRFSEDPPAGLLSRTIEVERGCCPFFHLDYDQDAHCLTITAQDAEHHRGLDALAQALTPGDATEALPPTAGNQPSADDPTRAECCSSTFLAGCCDTCEKGTCCGEQTAAPPAQCGCRA